MWDALVAKVLPWDWCGVKVEGNFLTTRQMLLASDSVRCCVHGSC